MLDAVFGAEMPLAVRFAILGVALIIVLFVALYVVRSMFGKKGTIPQTKLTGSWSLRHGIVTLAEALAILQVIFFTMTGAISGGTIARMLVAVGNNDPFQIQTAVTGGSLVGGFFGFLSSVIVLGLLFVIAEIERNTRHTAAMFERIANRTQE